MKHVEKSSVLSIQQSQETFKSFLQHVLALSHGETDFMKPNPMQLVASCDMAFTLCSIPFRFMFKLKSMLWLKL